MEPLELPTQDDPLVREIEKIMRQQHRRDRRTIANLNLSPARAPWRPAAVQARRSESRERHKATEAVLTRDAGDDEDLDSIEKEVEELSSKETYSKQDCRRLRELAEMPAPKAHRGTSRGSAGSDSEDLDSVEKRWKRKYTAE